MSLNILRVQALFHSQWTVPWTIDLSTHFSFLLHELPLSETVGVSYSDVRIIRLVPVARQFGYSNVSNVGYENVF